MRRDAEQKNHETHCGDRLMPACLGSSQNVRQRDHGHRQAEAGACDPDPPVGRQPGGNHFIPRQLRRLDLGGLSRKAQVNADSFVKRVQPQGPFPCYNGRPRMAALPFGVAEILKGAGGGSERGGFLKCSGCARIIGGMISLRAGEEQRVRWGAAANRRNQSENGHHGSMRQPDYRTTRPQDYRPLTSDF